LPAQGDFLWCALAHKTSESARLPTFCRRDSREGATLAITRQQRYWSRILSVGLRSGSPIAHDAALVRALRCS